ncbi:unnamed protein product [Rotaria sp. Silwood2]|nr:unnamed protein product [Rotaria sp. Silwood2]CAF2793669.1 unnamed protein product [Rotaria sp. Silwood2]CAF2921980.1 unnamed protein product [Rotaria sp. Silwood2]CAF3024000.1 unnamed protein product [Rotaria sp. Silwood2]CAF4172949.1 unnamed protein product [Rotaria sp. Silwood2]
MNDELPSESTRRSSSHSTIRSSGKAYNSNSSITLSSIKTKKSKSTTLKNTTIKVKSPVIHRKSGLKKNRQSLATEKKRTVLHSTLKKNRSATILQNLNSSDDEIQMDYGEQRTTRPDSNLPVTTPNNIKTEESANNHDDSFDSSQTIDIDRVQPKKKQNKSTIKSKQDVLKYFIIISTGELKCKLCKDSSKLFAKSSMESDSNLRSHLGRIHDLDGFLYPSQRKKPLPKEKSITFNQKQLLNAAAIEAIIRDSHAFNLFRKPGMQHFLSIAVPGYRGPHRKTVIKRLKPMYKQRRADIREKFSHITDVSLSADVWKSNNKSHFIGLTAQYYDDEYQYHTMVIAFRRFIGKHSADRLERFIEKEINKLNIKSKVCAITTDNGSDIRSATQRLSKFGIKVSCILHNFNLITQNGLWLFKIPKKM